MNLTLLIPSSFFSHGLTATQAQKVRNKETSLNKNYVAQALDIMAIYLDTWIGEVTLERVCNQWGFPV